MVNRKQYNQLLEDRQTYQALKEQLYQQNKNANLSHINNMINNISEQIRNYKTSNDEIQETNCEFTSYLDSEPVYEEPIKYSFNQDFSTPFDEDFIEPEKESIHIMSIEEFSEENQTIASILNNFEQLTMLPTRVIKELQEVILANKKLIERHIYTNSYLAQFQGN